MVIVKVSYSYTLFKSLCQFSEVQIVLITCVMRRVIMRYVLCRYALCVVVFRKICSSYQNNTQRSIMNFWEESLLSKQHHDILEQCVQAWNVSELSNALKNLKGWSLDIHQKKLT